MSTKSIHERRIRAVTPEEIEGNVELVCRAEDVRA